ncbi:MAG TPA: hypothetical protein VN238_15625, partial [Solirubrobacteraceae bacterium]|nr:hypothetical protein [Solirubrobacteraceae bacterium]
MSRARSILTLLALVVLAAFAGPAAAQTPAAGVGPVQVAGPAETPTPAPPGTTKAERTARLYATTRGRALCLGFDRDGLELPPRSEGENQGISLSGGPSTSCAVDIPRDDAFYPFIMRIAPDDFSGLDVDDATVAGAVRAEV